MIYLLSLGKENPWLAAAEDHTYTSEEPLFLELHASAMLCLPSGECMSPDATVCTTLTSALYSSVTEEVVLNRQLMVCLLFFFVSQLMENKVKNIMYLFKILLSLYQYIYIYIYIFN